jgi:hypothetical protein
LERERDELIAAAAQAIPPDEHPADPTPSNWAWQIMTLGQDRRLIYKQAAETTVAMNKLRAERDEALAIHKRLAAERQALLETLGNLAEKIGLDVNDPALDTAPGKPSDVFAAPYLLLKTDNVSIRQRVEELERDLETERFRLVACDVVALADTTSSREHARQMHPDYRSAACDAVARRVDECIELRAKLAELERERDELRDGLAWYGEQSRLARLIHSEGDAGRNAIANDGGRRAARLLAGRDAAEPSTQGDTHAD